MPEDFFERWNRHRTSVGGAPIVRYADRPNRPNPAARRNPVNVANRAARTRQGLPGTPSMGRRSGAAGFSTSPERQASAFGSLMDSLTADYAESQQKQDVINRVVSQGEEDDPGFLGKIWGGLMESPVGDVLHQIGRPANALFQGLEDIAGQEENRGFSIEDLGATLSNLGQGFKHGWFYEGDPGGESGPSGFGQVYEAIKENPTSDVGGGLRSFEEAHPALEQALAMGVGAAGELGLDPLNFVMPAVPSVLRGGGLATGDVIREATQAAGRQGIADGLAATPGLFARSHLSPDDIAARAEAAIDDTLNNTVLNVAGGGAPHTRSLGGDAFPSMVSQRWAQSVIDSVSGKAEEMVQRLLTDPKAVKSWDIGAWRKLYPDFDEFYTELKARLIAEGHPITGGPVRVGRRIIDTSDAEVLAILQGPRRNPLLNELWTNIRNAHYTELEPHINELYKAVENPTTRTLGIRLGSGSRSTVVPIPVVGRAYAWVGDRLGRIPGVQGLGSALYEHRFPGLFAGRISRASAYGVKGMDNFMRDLEHLAKGNLASGVVKAFTPAEGQELFKALADHTFTFGDARMDEALDVLRKMRDERFYTELREGARSIDTESGRSLPGKAFDPDYQYLHLKGGTKSERAKFLEGRKNAYEKYGRPVGYGVAEAKAQGLRPIDDAFQAMQLHYMDSANNITRAYLWQDLAANYGIMNNATTTGISDLERRARSLKAVEYGKLSAAFKQAVKDTGGKFYIPRAMHEMGENFDEMMKWSTSQMGQFGRGFSAIINKFKIWTTIPYPGFHMRNFMGDTMMGMLDGVNPARYTEVMMKYAKSRRGISNVFKIIPGVEYNFKELMRLFREEANSGYLRMDIGTTTTRTAGKIGGIGRKIGSVAKDLSDDRELLPRLTHYLQALRDESKALWNKGMRDTDAIMVQARDAALWRVNHYKFDYNALLPWERNLKATVFPFYTYTRKAIPALMEQMFINPHYFQMANRWMMDNDGSAADAFNYMNMPQWVRDFGYGNLTDETNPLALTGEIFPTNVLDVLSSNSLKEASLDLLSTANPFIQAPVEQAMGRTLFDNRPIQGGAFDYAMSKIPFVGDIQQRFGNLPGVPGESPNPYFGEEGGFDWTKLLSDRLLGAGIPVRRISEGQQEQQMETNFDQLVDQPLQQFNYSQDRWSINMNGDGMFAIQDKLNGKQVGPMFPTPQEAIQFALTLPSFNAPSSSFVNQPPTGTDLSRLNQAVYQQP